MEPSCFGTLPAHQQGHIGHQVGRTGLKRVKKAPQVAENTDKLKSGATKWPPKTHSGTQRRPQRLKSSPPRPPERHLGGYMDTF